MSSTALPRAPAPVYASELTLNGDIEQQRAQRAFYHPSQSTLFDGPDRYAPAYEKEMDWSKAMAMENGAAKDTSVDKEKGLAPPSAPAPAPESDMAPEAAFRVEFHPGDPENPMVCTFSSSPQSPF